MANGVVLWKEKQQLQLKYLHSEHDINPKISTLCTQKRTPDGRKLELCVFHSCYNEVLPTDVDEINRLYNSCVDGIHDFCYCTNTFKVYDLCHIQEENRKKQEREHLNAMYKKLEKYDHNMDITYRFHNQFMLIFDDRRKMIQRKIELEKKYDNFKDDFVENPEYVTLLQLVYRAEQNLENKRKNIEKVYDLKPQKYPKDEFITIHSKDEFDVYSKAKHSLEHWYNKNAKNNTTREKEELFKLEIAIQNVTKILHSSYEIPCVYVYKAINALDDLYNFFKKDTNKLDLLTKIKHDLDKCSLEFDIYKEFIGKQNIDNIVKKIDKEQARVAEEERRNKQKSQSIQKLKASQQAFVVKLDGSIAKDTSDEPKLIIGSKDVTEDDKWNSLR